MCNRYAKFSINLVTGHKKYIRIPLASEENSISKLDSLIKLGLTIDSYQIN